MHKWFNFLKKERIYNDLYYKKPAFWFIVASFIVGVVIAICLLTNPVTPKDMLKVVDFVKLSNNGQHFITEFEASLGNKVKSGRIYVEEWYNGKQETDETFPFNMKILQLEEGIELDDPARKAAYISALERLIYQKITPHGEKWIYGTQEFAIFDIDRDGEKELIIRQDQLAMASMRVTVYDYDEKQKGLKIEYSGFPSHTFYENGVIVTMASHNHGPANTSEDFWPYSVHRYNEKLDLYEEIAYVECWLKEPDHATYEGMTFPHEADLDRDGMVYYIMSGEYALENPVDNAAYNVWREATVGDAPEITFSYKRLPDVRPPAKG